MKIVAIVLMLALPVLCLAQKEAITFGEVPPEALRMTTYNKDTSAAAVVLADFGESTIEYVQNKSSYFVKFERIQRIKILKKEGYEWGDFSIPLYYDGSNAEEVSNIKAITYNLEKGKVVETKLKNDAIFKEETDPHFKTVKFAMPNVKEGSVIEVTYRITSPFLYQLRSWQFQSTIPVALSEYRIRVPEYFDYKKLMQGYVPLLVNTTVPIARVMTLELRDQVTGGNITKRSIETEGRLGPAISREGTRKIEFTEHYSRWLVQDAPAFQQEPAMTTYRDYLSSISFELYSITMPDSPIRFFGKSWEKIGDEFLDNASFGGLIKGSGFLKEHVQKITAGMTDEKDKISAIYSFVKGNMVWDGRYRVYPTDNLRKAMESNKGSSSDINLIMLSMLQKAGIKAHPMLISTRNNGFIRRDFPRATQFNNVLVAIEFNEKIMLLDATDRSLPAGILPKTYLNGEGLVVKMGGSEWIRINPVKSRSTATTEVSLGEDGMIKGTVQITYDGYYAQDERKKYARAGKDAYLKEIGDSKGWEITASNLENMEKLTEQVKENLTFQSDGLVQGGGDKMYLSPLLLMRLPENPFKSESRNYPVDFGSPDENIYVAKIKLPAGWTTEELPKSKVIVISANSAKCVFNVTQVENVISVTSQLVINRALFGPEEYSGLRDFYAQVVAKHAELIVLKKNP